MNTYSIDLSKLFRGAVIFGVLSFAAAYTPTTNAAQGCGYGLHRTFYGKCVFNYPGRYATPAYYHRGCWRNWYGRLRCYR